MFAEAASDVGEMPLRELSKRLLYGAHYIDPVRKQNEPSGIAAKRCPVPCVNVDGSHGTLQKMVIDHPDLAYDISWHKSRVIAEHNLCLPALAEASCKHLWKMTGSTHTSKCLCALMRLCWRMRHAKPSTSWGPQPGGSGE